MTQQNYKGYSFQLSFLVYGVQILGIMEGVQDEGDEGSEEEEGDESDEADDITGLFLQTRYGRNTTSWKRVNYR